MGTWIIHDGTTIGLVIHQGEHRPTCTPWLAYKDRGIRLELRGHFHSEEAAAALLIEDYEDNKRCRMAEASCGG